jgi:hypothetical protein
MFFRGSRYEPVETATLTRPDGTEVRYKRLRFVVRPPAQLAYVAQEGDSLGTIAWTVFRDAEMWWRIADANADLSAEDLAAVPGRRLAVALPAR